MPAAVLKSLAKDAGVTLAKAEDTWDKAKEVAKEKEKEGTKIDNFWAFVVGLTKKMLGIKEELSQFHKFRIVESADHNVQNWDKPYLAKMEGIFMEFEEKNRNQNDRWYPMQIKEDIKNDPDILERLPVRGLLAQADHPEEDLNTSIRHVGGVITNLDFDRVQEQILGELLIPKTRDGYDIHALLQLGVPVGVSARGCGDVESDGRVTPEAYKCLTWDVVIDPSFKKATPEVTEIMERIESNHGFSGVPLFELNNKNAVKVDKRNGFLHEIFSDMMDEAKEINQKLHFRPLNETTKDTFQVYVNEETSPRGLIRMKGKDCILEINDQKETNQSPFKMVQLLSKKVGESASVEDSFFWDITRAIREGKSDRTSSLMGTMVNSVLREQNITPTDAQKKKIDESVSEFVKKMMEESVDERGTTRISNKVWNSIKEMLKDFEVKESYLLKFHELVGEVGTVILENKKKIPEAREIVLVRKDNDEFWTGSGWSPEYPDAMVFQDEQAIERQEEKVMKDTQDTVVDWIEDYGMDDEKEVGNFFGDSIEEQDEETHTDEATTSADIAYTNDQLPKKKVHEDDLPGDDLKQYLLKLDEMFKDVSSKFSLKPTKYAREKWTYEITTDPDVKSLGAQIHAYLQKEYSDLLELVEESTGRVSSYDYAMVGFPPIAKEMQKKIPSIQPRLDSGEKVPVVTLLMNETYNVDGAVGLVLFNTWFLKKDVNLVLGSTSQRSLFSESKDMLESAFRKNGYRIITSAMMENDACAIIAVPDDEVDENELKPVEVLPTAVATELPGYQTQLAPASSVMPADDKTVIMIVAPEGSEIPSTPVEPDLKVPPEAEPETARADITNNANEATDKKKDEEVEEEPPPKKKQKKEKEPESDKDKKEKSKKMEESKKRSYRKRIIETATRIVKVDSSRATAMEKEVARINGGSLTIGEMRTRLRKLGDFEQRLKLREQKRKKTLKETKQNLKRRSKRVKENTDLQIYKGAKGHTMKLNELRGFEDLTDKDFTVSEFRVLGDLQQSLTERDEGESGRLAGKLIKNKRA